LGTPTETIWPGVSTLKDYRSTFPNFSAQSLENSVKINGIVNIDGNGLDLLNRMLKYDPSDRISAKSAMNHV